MEKINETSLEQVNGGTGITTQELYVYNQYIKAVAARFDAFKEGNPGLSKAAYDAAKIKIAEEVYQALNEADKKLVDSFNEKMGFSNLTGVLVH